jgi:transposase-like protein
VLGIWIEQSQGSRFWAQGVIELRNRGVHEVLIVTVDDRD